MRHRIDRRWLSGAAALVALLAAWPGRIAAQEPGWQPQRTWVFVVGVLEWQAGHLYQSFPKKDRSDAELAEFFRRRGVPDDQVVALFDRQATLPRIEATLAGLLPRARAGDLLVFYYAGHGTRHQGRTYFANYDIGADPQKTGWAVSSIFDTIEKNFRGGRVLLAADCCYSGALGVEAARRRGRIAYATLASAQPNSASTGNWTFTNCLLQGLRGDPAADLNGDGLVLLDELARHTEAEMAFAEGQMPWFSTANGFDAALPLAAVLKQKDSRSGARVEVEWQGDWWPAQVLSVKNGKRFIRYAGYGAEWDEWVGPDRVRPYRPDQYQVGAAVQVEWERKWWPARVLDRRSGLHLIHYDGYGAEWDEWVGPRRIRPAAAPSRKGG
jgi:hypothetical protein